MITLERKTEIVAEMRNLQPNRECLSCPQSKAQDKLFEDRDGVSCVFFHPPVK